jgi:hypothetical protein
LLGPPPQHVLDLLLAGNDHPDVATRFANGFNDPPDYFEWFMEPDKAVRYLAEVTA